MLSGLVQSNARLMPPYMGQANALQCCAEDLDKARAPVCTVHDPLANTTISEPHCGLDHLGHVADSLIGVEDQGSIYHDLKRSNIMSRVSKASIYGSKPVLIDAQCITKLPPSGKYTGPALGTVDQMPPEAHGHFGEAFTDSRAHAFDFARYAWGLINDKDPFNYFICRCASCCSD